MIEKYNEIITEKDIKNNIKTEQEITIMRQKIIM